MESYRHGLAPEEAGELNKELEKHPDLKPKATFVFPLSRERQMAVDCVAHDKIPSTQELITLVQSEDEFMAKAGLYFLGQVRNFHEAFGDSIPELQSFLEAQRQNYPGLDQYLLQIKVEDNPVTAINELENAWDNGEIPKAYLKRSITALKAAGEKAVPFLTNLITETSIMQEEILNTLSECGPKGKEAAFKALTDEDLGYVTTEKLSVLFNNLGADYLERFWTAVKQYIESPESKLQIQIVKKMIETMGNLGQISLPYLDQLEPFGNPYLDENIKIAKLKAKFDQDKDLEPLKTLANSRLEQDQSLAMAAIEALGEAGLPVIKELAKSQITDIRNRAENHLMEGEKRPGLLTARKPALSTAELAPLEKRLKSLQEINDELKQSHPDDYVGITVYGSTAKGYSKAGSDIDASLITSSSTVSEHFKDKMDERGLDLCHPMYRMTKPYDTHGTRNREALFNGLFIGDQKKLLELQKYSLDHMSIDDWDMIRSEIAEHESQINKAMTRYIISPKKQKKMGLLIQLNRVPPPLEEARRIVNRRYEQMMAKQER